MLSSGLDIRARPLASTIWAVCYVTRATWPPRENSLSAGQALSIARQCEYAWAERYALQLEADALVALGDRDYAQAARREAEAMTRRLNPAGHGPGGGCGLAVLR